MKLVVPTSHIPESETEIKFETYRFYLQSIREVINSQWNSWQDLAGEYLDKQRRLQGISSFDDKWVERWMKIGWNTEYLLSVGSEDSELLRINNQWKPIQAYYAVYACSEAAAYVIDGNKADGHQKSLRKITDFFVKSGLSPWDKAFRGARGKSRSDHNPINFPENLAIPHNLERVGVEPLQMVAKCLKAEHNHRIDELFEKKPGKYKYAYDPGYTGLFHFLYRLRIKSNYRDVEIFVAEAPEENLRSFSKSLDLICFCSLLMMEILILRKCRKKYLLELGEKYLKMNSNAERLSKRLDYYRQSA